VDGNVEPFPALDACLACGVAERRRAKHFLMFHLPGWGSLGVARDAEIFFWAKEMKKQFSMRTKNKSATATDAETEEEEGSRACAKTMQLSLSPTGGCVESTRVLCLSWEFGFDF